MIFLSLKDISFAKKADEGYYLKYATYISSKGIKGFSELFRDYLENQENWIFPSPLRVGFIILSSIFIKIFGNSFLSLAYLSLCSYCLFLIVSFYFARKFFDEKIALLFTILLAFSPINMAMARRALTESTFNLFSALSIWLFFWLIKERSNLKYALFIFVYSFTILVKEISVLFFFIFILYLVFYKYLFKKSLYVKDFLCVGIPFIIVGFVYISLGGILNTIDTIKIILTSPKTNQYDILFCQGPWFRYIIDYMLLSPWIVILSIGFVFYYLISKGADERILYFIVILLGVFVIFNIFTKDIRHAMNIRYAIILDIPMRLFTLLMLKRLIECRFPKKGFMLITTLVIIISISDYINFYDLFLKGGIYDPVSFLLLKEREMIP